MNISYLLRDFLHRVALGVMQHRKTISLTAKDTFITGQLEAGEFGNTGEVLRAGLRLLEPEQLKLLARRQLIAGGDAAYARGEFTCYAAAGNLAAELKTMLRQNPHKLT